MRNIIMVMILIMVTCSCSQQKFVTKKTHVWGSKMVTKEEYDSLLYNHTFNFIKNYSPDN